MNRRSFFSFLAAVPVGVVASAKAEPNPIRVAEYFEYAGQNFNKEYVERGAFIAIGIICAVFGGIYYVSRAVRK